MTTTKTDAIAFAEKQLAKSKRDLQAIYKKNYNPTDRENLMRKIGCWIIILESLKGSES